MKTKLTMLGAALVCALILIWAVTGPHGSDPTISYSQFLREVQAGRVAEVKILADNSGADAASVQRKDGTSARTVLPSHYSVALDAMQRATVDVVIQDASKSLMPFLLNAVPFLILLAIWVFFMTKGRPLLGGR